MDKNISKKGFSPKNIHSLKSPSKKVVVVNLDSSIRSLITPVMKSKNIENTSLKCHPLIILKYLDYIPMLI
jgi:hypothetical protein